jgi:protein ATS1
MHQLYCIGSNGSGQLGCGHDEDIHSPAPILTSLGERTVLKIAAGGNHTLLLLSSREVLVAGNSPARTKLTGTLTTASEFLSIIINESIPLTFQNIAATWETSYLVTKNGQIYSSGVGRRGELGLGLGLKLSEAPQIIPDFPPSGTQIIDISGSMSHVVAVLSNGDVYGWGAGRKGQLGEPAVDCWSPRKIESIKFRAERAVCGKDFTFIVGSAETGEYSVIGSDKWNVKTVPNITRWKDIGASWGSLFVLLQSGKLLSWGRNDHQQLSPTTLPTVKAIAVGSEHAICISEGNQIFTWGWGEHGNCGPLKDTGNVDFGETQIHVSATPVQVGAGCATSWIVIHNDA